MVHAMAVVGGAHVSVTVSAEVATARRLVGAAPVEEAVLPVGDVAAFQTGIGNDTGGNADLAEPQTIWYRGR